MNFKNFVKSLLLAWVVVALAACSKKNKAAPVVEQIIPVKGDPMVFVQGTALDSASGIPIEFAQDPSQKWSMYRRVFAETPQVDYDQMLKTQQPADKEKTKAYKDSLVYLTFKDMGSGKFWLETEDKLFRIKLERHGERLLLENFS